MPSIVQNCSFSSVMVSSPFEWKILELDWKPQRTNKKHIDAGVKERPQTLLVPSEEIFSMFYEINISNTIYYFKPTNFNCAFCKFHIFFGCVYYVSCLPWFETKNKIRCIDAPKYTFTHRNLPESEMYVWIIQNVHEKSRF